MCMPVADIIVVFYVGNMQEEVEGVLKLQYWMNYASEASVCLSVCQTVYCLLVKATPTIVGEAFIFYL